MSLNGLGDIDQRYKNLTTKIGAMYIYIYVTMAVSAQYWRASEIQACVEGICVEVKTIFHRLESLRELHAENVGIQLL